MKEQEKELVIDIDDHESEEFTKNLREALLDGLYRVKEEKGLNSVREAMQHVLGDEMIRNLDNMRK